MGSSEKRGVKASHLDNWLGKGSSDQGKRAQGQAGWEKVRGSALNVLSVFGISSWSCLAGSWICSSEAEEQ